MRFFFLFIFHLFVCIVYANGGPVDGSSVLSAGEVRFLNMPSVELAKERLHIEIEGDYCFVKVEYTLKNTSLQEIENVEYGFPIDYIRNDYDEEFALNDSDIKELRFVFNGKELSSKTRDEFDLVSSERIFEGNVQEITSKRKWFFTTFSIKSKETVSLLVSYRIRSGFTDFATSKSFFTYFGEKALYWDFCPAQYWGNGTINDFEVMITAKNGSIDPGTLKTQGLPFIEKGGAYHYRSNSFNLKDAEPLLLTYMNTGGNMADFIRSTNLIHTNLPVKIKASSSQKNYPAKQAFDGNYATTWVPEKNGIGEWIELSVDTPFSLGALLIVGGYTKSKEIYYANNRLKKIKVEYIKGAHYDERSDENGEFIIDFPDAPFPENVPSFLYLSLSQKPSFATDFGDMSFGILKKMRITILEVYRGEKYNDTCISEILLLGYPVDTANE